MIPRSIPARFIKFHHTRAGHHLKFNLFYQQTRGRATRIQHVYQVCLCRASPSTRFKLIIHGRPGALIARNFNHAILKLSAGATKDFSPSLGVKA